METIKQPYGDGDQDIQYNGPVDTLDEGSVVDESEIEDQEPRLDASKYIRSPLQREAVRLERNRQRERVSRHTCVKINISLDQVSTPIAKKSIKQPLLCCVVNLHTLFVVILHDTMETTITTIHQ